MKLQVTSTANMNVAEYIRLNEEKKRIERLLENLKKEIKNDIAAGIPTVADGQEAYLCESIQYEWDAQKFRKEYPGLWIQCAVVDPAKAKLLLELGKITPEKANEIRTPKYTTSLRFRKEK